MATLRPSGMRSASSVPTRIDVGLRLETASVIGTDHTSPFSSRISRTTRK